MFRSHGPDRDRLTRREEEVIGLVASGLTNFLIAERLGISLDTVKSHVSSILSKLEARDREEAVGLWRSQRRQSQVHRALTLAGLTFGGVAVGLSVLLVAAGMALRSTTNQGSDQASTVASNTAAPVQDLPFRLCFSSSWQRPTMAQMAVPFADQRFGSGTFPNPESFSLYLQKVYRLIPGAISANAGFVALSGTQEQVGRLLSEDPSCTFQSSTGPPLVGVLVFVDYLPTSVQTEADGTLQVVAREQPGTMNTIEYELMDSHSDADLLVQDAAGRTIFQRSRGLTRQYGSDGQLSFALLTTTDQDEFSIDLGSTSLGFVALYASQDSAATATLETASNEALEPVPVAGYPNTWRAVAAARSAGSLKVSLKATQGGPAAVLLLSGNPPLPTN